MRGSTPLIVAGGGGGLLGGGGGGGGGDTVGSAGGGGGGDSGADANTLDFAVSGGSQGNGLVVLDWDSEANECALPAVLTPAPAGREPHLHRLTPTFTP